MGKMLALRESRLATIALLPAVVVVALAISCSTDPSAEPQGPFPASMDCDRCADVIRDLEFVREIAVTGNWLYAADPDGTRLERVNLQSGDTEALVRGEYAPLFLSVDAKSAYFVGIPLSGDLEVLAVAHDSTSLQTLATYQPTEVTFVGVRAGVALGLAQEEDGPHLWELGANEPSRDLGLLGQLGVMQCIDVSESGTVAWCDAEDGIWIMSPEATLTAEAVSVSTGARGSHVAWFGDAAVVTGSDNALFSVFRIKGTTSELVVETSEFSGVVGAESQGVLYFFNPVKGTLWSSAIGGPPKAVGFDASLFLGDAPLAADDAHLYIAGEGSDGGQVYRYTL